jgi:cytochrome c biogenesis protein CcmG/thiol:disulfide interchange protein DsbE
MPEVETRQRRTRRPLRGSGSHLRVASGLAVVATLILAVALANRFGTDPNLVASPLIDKPAPDLTLPRLDGQGELTSSELSGRVIVVNFWASWCVACRSEHDDLVATAAAFGDRGVTVVGVVYQDDPQAAAAFLDELGWGDNYHYVIDPGSRTAISFGVFGVPETFFIDAEGVIVGKITGESNAALLGTTLDQILAGERPIEHTAGTVQSGPGG